MKKILVIVVLVSLVAASCAGSRRLGCPKPGQEPRGRFRAYIESVEKKNIDLATSGAINYRDVAVVDAYVNEQILSYAEKISLKTEIIAGIIAEFSNQ